MRNFGKNSKRDFEKIAEIILGEELDVVAFQEILSEGSGVEKLLEQCVKYQLCNWDFCWASPRESDDPSKIEDMVLHDSRGEGYAYIWKKQKFQLAEFLKLGEKRIFEPRIINTLSNDVLADCSFFARTPYYIRLQPCYGGFFELRLINVHIYYGNNTISEVLKRKVEYDVLTQQIYPQISQRRYGNFRPAYTIAMGDYNLNIFRPQITTQSKNYLTEVYSYHDRTESYQVITIQDQLTTLKNPDISPAQPELVNSNNGYANNYDHFSYSPELSHLSGVKCGVIHAVEKYCGGDLSYYRTNISDHLPIVIEIEI